MSALIRVEDEVWVQVRPAADVPASTHPDDLRRAAALPHWRADRFLRGRGLLRELLRTTAPHLADADVVPDERGQPRLAGHPRAGVSISHSEGQLACALAAVRPVGVDVQHPAPSVGAGLARRLLRDHAPGVLALPPGEAAEAVAWVWTAQEACAKAAGSGLAGRPWTVDVTPGARRGRWGAYRWISLRDHSDTPLSCAFGATREG
ncbi:4'-phosphopantetheinyl transferase family protein [Streptomyces sp. NPDC060235]|uniref:4'-phosphopantetheinyl transferase family protein n=1 Tax=unclassified Streptomyces TaxID=2593676 RepID=UPI0036629A7F